MKYPRRLMCFAIVSLAIFCAAGSMAKEIVIGYTGPLSGPAAEYGQENGNGIDMAINELNAAGGITVKGTKYLLKLIKLDDRNDPNQAVNNTRKFREQYKAVAVFNPVFTCLSAMMKINEEKGNEILIMAYTSTPKLTQMGNKLLVGIPPSFLVYVQTMSDLAWSQGWRKAGVLITVGSYGDEWRKAFIDYWTKKGGTITADKPANYYKETDFSTQLKAVMTGNPDLLTIGGPSAPTALVLEQARKMGFKGGFILIEQARADYVAHLLKGYKLMENVISQTAVDNLPFRGTAQFDRKYKKSYKLMNTLGTIQNYNGMHALARAIVAAGTVDNVYAIRAAFPRAFPMLGDTFPAEMNGISAAGRIRSLSYVQMIKEGKYKKPDVYAWWITSPQEFNQLKKITKSTVPLKSMKIAE
jgi:branched-chain amino acid transport system substrate-binding protein